MMIRAETRNTDRRESDVLAAWSVYLISIAGLMIYSLLSVIA